jgi:hypothetical protein
MEIFRDVATAGDVRLSPDFAAAVAAKVNRPPFLLVIIGMLLRRCSLMRKRHNFFENWCVKRRVEEEKGKKDIL